MTYEDHHQFLIRALMKIGEWEALIMQPLKNLEEGKEYVSHPTPHTEGVFSSFQTKICKPFEEQQKAQIVRDSVERVQEEAEIQLQNGQS